MDYHAVVEALTFALGQERAVTVTLRDGQTVIGTPSMVDTHPTAIEATIIPIDDPDQVITVPLAAIVRVDI